MFVTYKSNIRREKWAIVASSIGKIHLQSAADTPTPVCVSVVGTSGLCDGISVAGIERLLELAQTQKRKRRKQRKQRVQNPSDESRRDNYTTKDFVRDIIKPLTAGRKESYLDMLKRTAPQQHRHTPSVSKQHSTELDVGVAGVVMVEEYALPPRFGPASVFVSHAWHANIVGMLESLLADHAHAAPSDNTAFYWIDFCCRNQHVSHDVCCSNYRRS